MVAERALLVDLLLLRGQVLGRIVDYERAAELVEVLVRAAPDEGLAWLARARTRATFHRFPEALADLHAAGRCGADRATLDAERAAILQAVGCYAEALVLRRAAVERRPDFASLGALAVLEAARGQVAEAERLFAEARCRYRGVSPLPVASLDFRRGLMWLGERDLPAARAWFDAAVRRVPAYAPALGHLAEIDAALGAHEAAIARLRPLAASSDDPEYPATLAGVLGDAGHPEEAEYWRSSAAARYDQLVLRHPEAFIDHAADFWLTVGDDPSTGLQLGRAQSRVPQHHEGGRRAPSPTAADRSVGAPQLSRYWCAGCAFRRQSLPGAVPSGGRTGCCGLRRLQPAFPELTALEGESDALLALGIAGGICDAGENCEDATETAAGRPLFGQFIAHDITADRSPLTHSTEFSDAINFRSPRADLECLYGSGPVGSPFLYRRDDPALLLLGRNDRGEEADVPRTPRERR